MRAALSGGASIIVVTGFEFADIVPDAAAENPGVKFLMVDECPAMPMPNVFCVLFKEYEANFLAGVEAGLSSKTGRVGTVASSDIPYMHRLQRRLRRRGSTGAGRCDDRSDPVGRWRQRVFRSAAGGEPGGGDAKPGRRSHARRHLGRQWRHLQGGREQRRRPDFRRRCRPMRRSPGHVLDSAVKHVDRITARAIEGLPGASSPTPCPMA